MTPPRILLPLLAVAGALAVPAAASAGQDCPLQAQGRPAEHAIGATGLVARDPYGGRLARNRLFFSFSVRGSDAALAGVAKAQWSMDGAVVREDPTAPFEWKGLSGSSKRMPAGDHTITVTVVPKDGSEPQSASFALTATDCQPATFWAFPQRHGDTRLTWESAFESAEGVPLTGVAAVAQKGVRVALPKRYRGRRIGSITIARSGHRPATYALRGATSALRRGKLRVRFVPRDRSFLDVTGLPSGTQSVAVRLRHDVAHVSGGRYVFGGGLVAGSGSVSLESAGIFV